MEAKHKNALIGALLAVVFVMAVGYAAFAQQLTITGSAEITSKWDVHFGTGTYDTTTGFTGGTAPTGSISVSDGSTSGTFSATLINPGDKVTYTVPIKNTGTIDAKLNTITLSSETENMVIDNSALTATTADGNIKYTVTSPGTATLANTNGTATLTVVAEYVDKTANGGNANANGVSAALTVTMNYIQA